ncbi:MAG: DegQ family serine endoprotease [Acidobacteria bacterium]|nr:MAG: DegQ family serine endoprotease [Acidobacteriota bacterium]
MPRFSKQFLRENFLGLSLTMIGVLCLVLASVMYVGHRSYANIVLADGQALSGPDISLLEQLNKAYERVAQAVTPAVVYISTTQVMKVQQSPFFSDPFFRRFFGNMPGTLPQKQILHALGSGVIVSPQGYIVTNNHVIAQASDIEVMLSDKRNFKAKVIGTDKETDLAIIKIEADKLPVASWGDSQGLKVGDIVMAFGNPFGQNFSVTRGTVSALGRSGIEPGGLENFIQTDAAINPGNSGGALVNVRGQVVGINTAILSGNSGPGGEGSFLGIGFAIPSNTVKHVMEDLIKSGKVSRGYLGVLVSNVTPDFAKEFDVPDTSGAFVQNVEPEGPAAKSGLQNGDVVRKYNGKDVADAGALTAMVTQTDPGSTAALSILRNGKPMEIKVTLGERPANAGAAPNRGQAPSGSALEGISVQNLTPGMRDQLGIPANVNGVVVSDVDQSSPAAEYLQQGDVIQSINRQPVHNVNDFNKLAGEAKGQVLLRVIHQGQGFFVVISPGPGDGGGQ